MEITPWDGTPIKADFAGFLTMSEKQYHSDPCELPSLSASIAKKMVQNTPLHAHLYHPKLGGLKTEETKAMRRGTVIHALIFNEPTNAVLIDADDFRTKAAQGARDSAIAEGKIPYLLSEFREAEVIADEVLDACRREGIHLSGAHELVAIWHESVDRRKVQCRARIDHTVHYEGIIHDFKTIDNCHPDFISRQCFNLGYDIQWAAYTSAVGKLEDLEGRVDFSWVFIEELPAGASRKTIVQVDRPGGLMRELGKLRWAQAVVKWEECLRTDYWPAYSVGPGLVDPPEWAAKQALGRE